MKTHSRMNRSLRGCLYSLAVSMENICCMLSTETFVRCLHGNLCTEFVSRNPPPWKRVLLSQQRCGFQDPTTSIFYIHGHVCLTPSELCSRIVSPRKCVCQFVSWKRPTYDSIILLYVAGHFQVSMLISTSI
jgi:hypothetical protein